MYLIEVNTNPCLELASPLLARLIPSMIDNALRLTIDPYFPPPEGFSQKKQQIYANDLCPENKMELIFDEKVDGPVIKELMKEQNNVISKCICDVMGVCVVEIDEEELSDEDEDENT